ncbi:MAG: response regulator [Cyanobacteria bacterium P01_F01_bin.150]
MKMFSLDRGHKPTDALLALMHTPQDGIVQITGEGVTWCLEFLAGRLRYCNHSLQTFSAVELHLQALGYEQAIKPSRQIFYQQDRDRHASGQMMERLSWLHRLIQQLAIQGTLSWTQANILIAQLTKDSLESILWLTHGVITPLPDAVQIYNTYDTKWQGNHFNVLMNLLLKRLQIWQTLCPHIGSPHQCPYFVDVQRIYEDIPGGMIPTSMLLALKHVMGGVSLRQLSQVLRQDELKLAQLLYPYVKQGVVCIDPPEPPLDRLPLVRLVERSDNSPHANQSALASFPQSSQPSNPSNISTAQAYYPSISSTAFKPRATYADSQKIGATNALGADSLSTARSQKQIPKQAKKQYKIVCIDDSPTMLETLKCYLDDDCFEVTTLDNPMKSASTMFSSRPDLVLMDVAMPGIKGDRLCKILRQSSAFKTTPIIMVTGLTGEVDKADAIAMGANDYLAKPFSQETLLELVNQYLHPS